MPTGVHGLVIGGGDDIASDLYAASAAFDRNADRKRDRFELEAIHHAVAIGLPILGICRGAQLINVAAGGTLYADITEQRRHTSNAVNPLSCKTITVRDGSRLRTISTRSRARVNSLHHQAVHRLGKGLMASARDADGFVQAIETRDSVFRIGVQWHPEYLFYRPMQHRLFQALVEAARAFTVARHSEAAHEKRPPGKPARP